MSNPVEWAVTNGVRTIDHLEHDAAVAMADEWNEGLGRKEWEVIKSQASDTEHWFFK